MPNVRAGSCTLRLQNIHTLSSAAKKDLLQAIANDITATFISIAQHTTAGHLSKPHTEPVHNVIALIQDTAQSQRRALERKVLRHQQRLRQARREQRWMRREFGQLVRRIQASPRSRPD